MRARGNPECQRALVYIEAERVIGIYGMGLTQHVRGFQNITGLCLNRIEHGFPQESLGRMGPEVGRAAGRGNRRMARTYGKLNAPGAQLYRVVKEAIFGGPRYPVFDPDTQRLALCGKGVGRLSIT